MISVVMPALNEERSIAETVRRTGEALKSVGIDEYEIIVVDDGSADRTAELAAAGGASVIRHPANAGYGFSLKDGIRAAKHDTIVILDADRTYRPESIPELLKEYAKGFDMVVGARSGKYYRESLLKAPLRAILKLLVEFTTGRKIPDINSGLRVFSKRAVSPYLGNLCDTFSFSTSLTLAYMMANKFVSHVPVPYDKREGGTKVRLFRDSLRTIQYIVDAILFFNPIKLFLVLCAITLGAFAAAAAALAFFRPLAAVYVFMGGVGTAILVFALGLVATLIKMIYGKERV